MNNKMNELPSGRMINTDDIIYISDIKCKTNVLEDIYYYFDVLWANGQKVNIKFMDKGKCDSDWHCLKSIMRSQ